MAHSPRPDVRRWSGWRCRALLFLQQWLSDLAMEEVLFEPARCREFWGLSEVERSPDQVSILRFRHLLEEHPLAPQIPTLSPKNAEY